MRTTQLYFDRAAFHWPCWTCGNSWNLLEYNDKGWTLDGVNRIEGTPKKLRDGLEIEVICPRCKEKSKVTISLEFFFPWGKDEWAKLWAKLQKVKNKYEAKLPAENKKWVIKEGVKHGYTIKLTPKEEALQEHRRRRAKIKARNKLKRGRKL